MMNRRNFLAAAAAFAPAMFVRAAETKRKVVVVGGGLAGLSCAYELRKLGFALHSSSKVIGALLLQGIAKNHLRTRSAKLL